MIAVDTNVLVRLFVSDDRRQHLASTRFFEARSRDDAVFVSFVTAIEFVWVLKRTFKVQQSEALGLLLRVINKADTVVESADHLREGIDIAMASGGDFADVMIALAAERAGVATTVTFDHDAARNVPGMELLR